MKPFTPKQNWSISQFTLHDGLPLAKWAFAFLALSTTFCSTSYATTLPSTKVLALEKTNREITGTVTDENGAAIPGVNVVIQGTTQGTITNGEGYFQITLPDNATSILTISFVGYKTQQVTVSNQKTLAIMLEVEQTALAEVVVTALGIRKETKALGYSVTRIKGDEFTKVRDSNFGNSLVGKVAGVNVTGVPAGPGASSRVTIRGNTSISGDNQPLYVVNGLPINNTYFGETPTAATPDWGDNISSINPDDIEEITVLKGATAAALYGSRAKNGAIVITTKTGKGNKGIGIDFNSNNTFEVPKFLWQLQKEYGQGYGGVKPASVQDAANHGQNHWGSLYDNSMTMQFDGVERPYTYVKDQVLDDFYSVGHTSSNNVSFSGGNEKGSFRVGVTDMRMKGIIPTASLRRNNISVSLTQQATKNITVSANIDYIKEEAHNRIVSRGSNGGAPSTILFVNSNMPTSALAPGYNNRFFEKTLGSDLNATNPYFALNRMRNTSDKNRFIGSVNVRWNLFDWLFIQGKVGQDYFDYHMNNLIPDGTGFRPNGQIFDDKISFTERNFEGLIGLDKALNSDWNLSANLGGNMMAQYNLITNIIGSGFVIPQFHVINNTSVREVKTNALNKKINSIFGTAELSFRNYLFLNVTGRNDWFSTLNPAYNNYFYPSAGLSYVFSETMKLPKAINFGKLRLAYASVGGDTDPYQLNLTYGLLGYNYNGLPLGTMSQTKVPNANLRPLSVNEAELGLDLRMFNNRLGIDFAVYNKLTRNDIAMKSISTTSGYDGVAVNVGEIRNRGLELLLTGTPIQKADFKWEVSFNMGYNKSKVLKISDDSKELAVASSTKAFIRHIEGQEYSQIVGRTIKRNAEGKDIIDATGLPIVPVEVVSFGSGIHRLTTGITNNFTYKSFTLSALVDAKFGAKIYSETNYSLEHRGMSYGSLIGRKDGIILDGVTEAGEVNNVHVSAERANNRAIIVRRRDALDDYLYNASFIKLRSLSVTYQLPKAVYQKLGFIQGASLSLVGRNLAILMSHTPGIDPESQSSAGNAQGLEYNALPFTRSFGFNVNLKF